ncbi:IS66 family transposase [Bradyrhizobium ottawaense]|uniref:IS66 family transposase n=1 Tax=Bradyrhizobium ottawaense TaxID=931866 RepID=UPI003FA173DC
MLRACAAGLLRAGRHREERPGRQQGQTGLPIALEAIRRLDALFEIERAVNGRSADERRAVRQKKSKPLFDDMKAWLLSEREAPRAPSRS